MYLRAALSYYERQALGVYPGPRARLRGLRGLAQDETGVTDGVPAFTPDQIAALSTSQPPAPSTAMPQPIAPAVNYPNVAPPNLPAISTAFSPAQIAAISSAQPSPLAATYGGISITTWVIGGILLIAGAAAFGAGARH